MSNWAETVGDSHSNWDFAMAALAAPDCIVVAVMAVVLVAHPTLELLYESIHGSIQFQFSI